MDFSLLKHNNLEIDIKLVSELIWYSVAISSYIQRNCNLDNTWINEKISNPYISFLCRKKLNIVEFNIFETQSKCNCFVRERDAIPKNTIGIYLTKESLFFDMCNKIRNSVAHGTFNVVNKELFGIGQAKPKIESEINFYYNFEISDLDAIDNFFNAVFDLAKMDKNDLISFAIKYLNGERAGNNEFKIKETFYFFVNMELIPSKNAIEKVEEKCNRNKIYIFNNIHHIPSLSKQIDELKTSKVLITVDEFLNMF